MTATKTIFITGAASGIGRATAKLFASRNWFVGLFDVDAAGLSALADEIGKDNVCFHSMDVAKFADVQKAVADFSGRTKGQMNVLFNCAGILRMGLHETIAIADHAKIVEINVIGILNCIHACFDLLRSTPNAHIVNMSSASTLYGTPELATYSASKYAVRGLTEALNIEFERHDIQVSDVMAPYVQTPMITDADVKAYSVKKLGVNLTPEQVARTVWKAAHGKRIHWKVSFLLKALVLFCAALPFLKRSAVKILTFSPHRNH